MRTTIFPVLIFLIFLSTSIVKGQSIKLKNNPFRSIENWDSIAYRETNQMTKKLKLSEKQDKELLKINTIFFKSIGELPTPKDSISLKHRGEQLKVLKLEREQALTKLLTESQQKQYRLDMAAVEVDFKKKMVEMNEKLHKKTKP